MRQENFEGLLAFVTACAKNYLEYCFPSQVGLAVQFAEDLIETLPTWKAADFINLFKFFRHNQGLEGLKVFGNTITPQRLMEMVTVYEEHRANEFENYRREELGKHKEENRQANPLVEKLALKLRADGKVPTGDRELGRQSEQAAAKQEQLRMSGKLNERKVAPDENYFKQGVKTL